MIRARQGALALIVIAPMACRPGDVLSVPAPAGVVATASIQSQAGAEGVFIAARGQLFAATGDGLLEWSELLTDEFTFSGFRYQAAYANIDARSTAGSGGFAENGDTPWENLLRARGSLLSAAPLLAQYEPASGKAKAGEAYALAGYAELLIAESYCAGTPLSSVLPGGAGIQYGTPLTTDSLLAVAEAHFDSALGRASDDANVTALASVGLGRTLLDRNQYAGAATAVTNVPTGFLYNVELQPTEDAPPYTPNIYAYGVENASFVNFNVADIEGGNGLNYISAHDPRLTFDSSITTQDGGPWYLPMKFEANLSYIPLATGVEARLIEAEAALRGGQLVAWATYLRSLRGDSADTHVVFPVADSLPADSAEDASADAQTDFTFRERAFWLFGTGTRLGDLRRLIRQYGRDQSVVFPAGIYVNGNNPNLPAPIPSYGSDVSLTLPTKASSITFGNPNYKGCLSSPGTA